MSDKAKRTDYWRVPYTKLKIVPGFNARFNLRDIPALKDSIRDNGIKVPLSGWREGDFFVVKDGHRRHAAMKMLFEEDGIDIICQFILEPKHYNPERRIVDMFLMNDGEKLSPLEQAHAISRLINYGWDDASIAKSIGKHINYVQRLMGLAAAPQRFQDLVFHEKIAATLAMDIIQKGEVTMVLAEVDAGKFSFSPNVEGSESKGKARITAKDLNRVNSWGAFKKYAKKNEGDLLPPQKAEVYQLLCRMLKNELTLEQIDDYFKI